MRRYPLYGNVIVDSSNSTALGGTLTISNSCNTSLLNNRASIAFAVADISYGAIKKGLFSNNVDTADARITAIIDTVSPTVGTGLSVSISPNHANPPVEALRIRSNGNVGIGTQTPQFTLDVNGNIRLGTGTTGNIRFGTSGVGTTQAGYIDLVNNNMTVMNQQNGNLIFGTNNAEDMRILTNGNVGIGTQTPEFTLDVNGNARIGTTSTNTFTLFNNPFRYVPWTNIYNYSGGAIDASFTSVVTAQTTTPRPAISTATRINYMYSVVGNTLYINYYYFHTAAGTTGNGIYLYLLPSGFTVTSINTALRNNFSGLGASNINNGIKIGTGSIYESGTINKVVSCYYTEISSVGYIVLFSDVLGQSNYHRSNVNAYNTFPLYVTFEAAIPLA